MRDPEAIIIGSRGSALALWQANWIKDRLAGAAGDIKVIRTTGDRITDVPLAQVGSKGLFTKEIEEALLAAEIDVAVHSLKDMPTELPEGLTLAAIPEREDVRDAMVGLRLDQLKPGARVGTSSLRRSAQLKAMRPDLVMRPIRGNVDTRIRKLDEGEFEAIVLAAAGLRRLGLAGRIAELLEPSVMLPAAGQGALAVETRSGGRGFEQVQALNHFPTRAAATAERAMLRALGGGCQVPIGGYARERNGSVELDGLVIAPDGSRVVRASERGAAADAEAVGEALARRLRELGAEAILEAVYGPK
ncbi:MAG: hydroxymethylbilane synthase [Bryobacteraceae bacterium]|nr:hydroxymethylbilane synthase [Bryobacteraceae bacterium]